MANPLLELFVRIAVEGEKDVDKTFEKLEDRAQKIDKAFDDLPKKVDKQVKAVNKSFETITKSLDTVKEKQDAWVKSIEAGSKKISSALDGVGKTLDSVQGKVDKLNKSGLSFGAELRGGNEVTSGLDDIAERIQNLKKDSEITLTIKLNGGQETLDQLNQIRDAKAEITGDSEITMTAKVNGGEESVTTLHNIRDALSDIGDNRDVTMDIEAKGGAETAAELKATDVAADRLDGRNVKMNIDAKGAEVLPALLGDINAQLSRFQFIMAAVAAATIPTFIAGIGAAGSAIAVATAGVGALAVGLGAGLVGAAGAAGAAVGLAYASLGSLGAGAASALSNILGLSKGFGSFDGAIKAAEKEVKGFTELVGKMPAGTEAAAQAQDRLNESIEYQRKLTELQVEWWGKYGDAANDAAVQIDELRLGFIEIVNDLGGQLIPTITEFVEIANQHLPAVADAADVMAGSVGDATAELTKFLESAQGLEDVDNIITAIGESAGPSLTILSNGLIVALQVLQPLIPAGQEILTILADLSTRAAEFAQSAEGMQAISDAWQLMFGYATQLGEAVANLAIAGQQVSAAFLSSGLVDFMVQGFVDMTASIRSAAEGANQADSAFQQFLQDAMPILSAAREALGQIVSEGLRVVGAITSMRDEATGALIMVEIFNGIRDAATPLAELLISTFSDLGPIIAELIPNIAQFLQLFLGSTPELTIFLGVFNDLLTAFNALPDSVQVVAARLLTYSLILSQLGSPITNVVTGLTSMYTNFLLLRAVTGAGLFTNLVLDIKLLATYFASASLAVQEFTASMYAAVAAGEIALGVLAALAAIATIAILVAIYFDTDAFKQAYAEAKAAGESTGGAFGAGVIAGLEAVPIAGAAVKWVDENIGQPIDQWLSDTDLGIDEWIGEQMADADAQLAEDSQNIRDTLTSAWEGASEDAESKFGPVADRLSEVIQGADAQLATDSQSVRDTLGGAWDGAVTDVDSKFGPVGTKLSEVIQSADTQLATDSQSVRDTLGAAWDGAVTDADSRFGPVKDSLSKTIQDADTQLQTDSEALRSKLAEKWDEASSDAETRFKPVKDWIVKYLTEADDEGSQQADEMNQHVSNAWDLLGVSTDEAWTGMKNVVLAMIGEIVARISGGLIPAIQNAITFMGNLKSAAVQLENYLGIGSPGTAMGSGMGGQGTGPGGRTGMARGGIEEQPQGPTGGISDGLHPRVVYGEQDRKVTESYIVWDRKDNVPILEETARGMGYGLVRMAKGGTQKAKSGDITQTVTSGGTTPTSGGGTTPTTGTGEVPPFAPVASPTPSELAPYMADAAAQQGYMPTGIPAADWTGSDHINTPEGTTSGDPVGGQGGSVATPWPGLAAIASGGSATAWTERNPSGPSFAMAAGGTLPSGGSGASGATPVPLSYQAVPLGTWNQFLGLQWLADPTMDFPVLYPPDAWSPDQIYSPAMMRRGGILRGGTRYFQGGGLNQAQIEAGLAAGNSALGAFYSYGSAGEDGGFDCAGIWNYIESAVAYGTPQTGKRWGTEAAASGSAGSFTTPGVTPGGVNIGVDLSGWGGPDDTHMAGDIQDTAFESDVVSGVHNGNSSAAFGTQYTMGGAADVAGMLPSDAGVAPPSTSPQPTMDSTVSDWWNTLAPPVPDATGQTATNTNQTSQPQVNIKMNANTGNKQSGGGGGGKTGNITQTQNITGGSSAGGGSAPAATGASSPASATSGGSGAGGSLVDGVQNWMAALPGVTEGYLQNVGQQTLGTAGQFSQPPLGNTIDDWIIAALEGMGMDPTPEAIATIASLMMQESGGDPAAVSPDGATGVMQMMPETWAAYNVGGDINDPVANIMASINYQLQRYGGLVDFSPYKDGGIPLSPHFGLVGEAGPEAMIPLSNNRAMTMIRSGLGMEGMDESIAALAERIDGVREELRYQTRVMPERTGSSMKAGYDNALARDAVTQRAKQNGDERAARRDFVAGRR